MVLYSLIPDFNNKYLISNTGQVMSIMRTPKILKTKLDKNGYEIVRIFKDNKCYYKKIHRLVCIAFIQNPNNKQEVNHIDLNKTNNIVSNLEWNTRKENVYHFLKSGKKKKYPCGFKHNNSKLNKEQVLKIRNKLYKGESMSKIAKKFNVSTNPIFRIKHNKHNGGM